LLEVYFSHVHESGDIKGKNVYHLPNGRVIRFFLVILKQKFLQNIKTMGTLFS